MYRRDLRFFNRELGLPTLAIVNATSSHGSDRLSDGSNHIRRNTLEEGQSLQRERRDIKEKGRKKEDKETRRERRCDRREVGGGKEQEKDQEFFSPISGRGPSVDTGNWSPRGCNGSWSCSSSPLAGDRNCRHVLCRLA